MQGSSLTYAQHTSTYVLRWGPCHKACAAHMSRQIYPKSCPKPGCCCWLRGVLVLCRPHLGSLTADCNTTTSNKLSDNGSGCISCHFTYNQKKLIPSGDLHHVHS